MKLFTTRTHGMVDYFLGALLIALPWVLGWGAGAERGVPVATGVVLIGYSLLTDYEFGVVRRIEPTVHLWLDGLAGLLLAVSPWVFGFDQRVWIPHVVLGVVAIIAALFSDTIPGYERRRASRG